MNCAGRIKVVSGRCVFRLNRFRVALTYGYGRILSRQRKFRISVRLGFVQSRLTMMCKLALCSVYHDVKMLLKSCHDG